VCATRQPDDITDRWSHLIADTQDELHRFAIGTLGLRRSYFQPGKLRGDGSPSPFWHYDLTSGKRWQAIRHGALPLFLGDSADLGHNEGRTVQRYVELRRKASTASTLRWSSEEPSMPSFSRMLPTCASTVLGLSDNL
jgi:hypothetical protein